MTAEECATLEAPLRAITHSCGFIYSQVSVIEPRNVVRDASDLLISNSSLGQSLPRTLGSAALALMRGHGAAVVGASVQEAVYRAVYAGTNARMQSEAIRYGFPVYLPAARPRRAPGPFRLTLSADGPCGWSKCTHKN